MPGCVLDTEHNSLLHEAYIPVVPFYNIHTSSRPEYFLPQLLWVVVAFGLSTATPSPEHHHCHHHLEPHALVVRQHIQGWVSHAHHCVHGNYVHVCKPTLLLCCLFILVFISFCPHAPHFHSLILHRQSHFSNVLHGFLLI